MNKRRPLIRVRGKGLRIDRDQLYPVITWPWVFHYSVSLTSAPRWGFFPSNAFGGKFYAIGDRKGMMKVIKSPLRLTRACRFRRRHRRHHRRC